MNAHNRDLDFQRFWLGPEENKLVEGFDGLYKIGDTYAIPNPTPVIKQKLEKLQEKNSRKGDSLSVETAMSNIFGKFGFGGQKEGHFAGEPADFFAPPKVSPEESIRSPLQVISNTAAVNIVVVEPRSFDEAVEIVNHLKQRKSVIVNLQQLDPETSMRVLDFVSGATYAMDGTQERVGNGVFIFASVNCRVESESEGTRAYKDLFAKTFGV